MTDEVSRKGEKGFFAGFSARKPRLRRIVTSRQPTLTMPKALFILLLLFIIFSKRVALIVGLLSNPNGRSHFSGCPAKTLRQKGLANSG
jgi:hypothetical protein